MATETRISDVIDRQRLSGLQKRVMVLCGFLAFVEGFNAQIAGFVAPTLAAVFHLSPNAIGVFLTSGLAGLMLGALVVAPFADRVGRKTILVACAILFGLGSLATSAATSADGLYILRFLAGVGIGGAMPNCIAMTSEYAPHRVRSLAVVMMYNGFILGALGAGLAASQIIEAFGWQSLFVVGGVLPLLLAPLLIVWLPESVRFLALKDGAEARTAAIMAQIDPTLAGVSTRYTLDHGVGAKMSVTALFASGRVRRTVLLWVIFFMSLLDLFVISSWLPTQIKSLGFTLGVSIIVASLFQFAGIIGMVLGWLMDKIGSSRTLTLSYLIAAVGVSCIGFAGSDLALIIVAVLGAGFGLVGGQTAANAVAANSYPTEIRSTGVGWALGIGRIGSIVGPTVAGFFISMHISNRDYFLMATVPMLCAAAAAALLGKDKPSSTGGH